MGYRQIRPAVVSRASAVVAHLLGIAALGMDTGKSYGRSCIVGENEQVATVLGLAYDETCTWTWLIIHSGSDKTYCGTGCDARFGDCIAASPEPTDTTNGLCGERFNASCSNYGDKTCCSQNGYWWV